MTDTTTLDDFSEKTVALPNANAVSLCEELADWGKVTVIIIHAGSVFEFKGPFPKGSVAHGFYNLSNNGLGFEGHLNLEKVESIELQSKLHRGRPSYAFLFKTEKEVMFKVFLGRDEKGEILPEQLEKFLTLQNNA